MEIPGPQLPLAIALLSKSPQAVVDAWKVGQLVNATAITSQQNGQATLNIGGTIVLAHTRLPIQPGQTLKLEVSSLATLAILRIIDGNRQGPASAPITITLQPHANLLKQLQAGNIIEATIAKAPDKGQSALLTLAGTRVNVNLSQPLPSSIQSNQPIKLEVINPGKIPTLRILTPMVQSSGLHQALRNTLPQQQPLPPLLANLSFVAQKINPLTQKLPQSLVDISRDIVNHLPTTRTINSGEGLKQAITQSGLFLEAKLAQSIQGNQGTAAQATPNVSIDFKGGLLSLLASLFTLTRAAPGMGQAQPNTSTALNSGSQAHLPHLQLHGQPTAQPTLNQHMGLQQALIELLRQVEGGLARLQLTQLISSHTPTEEDGKRAWVMELPIRHGENIDLIQLRIQKEKQADGKKKNALWCVNLAFDLRELGPIQARVLLADGVISTTFWSEKEHTNKLINDHLKILDQRFKEVGLNVGLLKAHKGQSPENVITSSSLPSILLDVQA